MSQRKLENRSAIVTGAASGIGRAIATTFIEHGARVVVADLPGQSLKDKFPTAAARCVETDIIDTDAPERIVGTCIDAFGGLDILVNNAGICLAGEFEDVTIEQWNRILAVNVTPMFRLSQQAVPQMKKRGGGRIINLGSIMSDMTGPTLSIYSMSKHAVAGLTKGMAVDLGKHRITVNYLQPGTIVTALSEPFMADTDFRTYWETKTPLGRLGQPEEVAAAALFLASDDARYVSGLGMNVDGGAIVNF